MKKYQTVFGGEVEFQGGEYVCIGNPSSEFPVGYPVPAALVIGVPMAR